MPVGKNSLKRVTNNGYSAVKTEAPDMENSVIAEVKDTPKAESAPKEKAPKPTEKAAPVSRKTASAPKNTAAKPRKTAEKPKPAAPKTSDIPRAPEVAATVIGKNGKSYCNIGEEMPIYLL